MEKKDAVEGIVRTMVESICAYPEKLQILSEETLYEGEPFLRLNVLVGKEDVSVCIGSKGSTADSLRRIATLTAQKLEYERGVYLRVSPIEK